MYTLNHEMMNYDFVEGTEFNGLMPKAIDAIGGVGVNDEQPVVEFMGFRALGSDPLEIVDAEKVFGEQEGSSDSSSASGETVNP